MISAGEEVLLHTPSDVEMNPWPPPLKATKSGRIASYGGISEGIRRP